MFCQANVIFELIEVRKDLRIILCLYRLLDSEYKLLEHSQCYFVQTLSSSLFN